VLISSTLPHQHCHSRVISENNLSLGWSFSCQAFALRPFLQASPCRTYCTFSVKSSSVQVLYSLHVLFLRKTYEVGISLRDDIVLRIEDDELRITTLKRHLQRAQRLVRKHVKPGTKVGSPGTTSCAAREETLR